MKKLFLIMALTLPLTVLIIWGSCLWVTRGIRQEIVLPIQGYDPRDLLAGHYLSYQIKWEEADCTQFEDGVCPVETFPKEMRFYVPEHQAARLERILLQKDPMVIFQIVFAYKPHTTPIAKEMRINGFDWQIYLRRFQK